MNDPDFEANFPNAGDPQANRQRSVAEIDKWIANNAEKAYLYRGVVQDMRDQAVRGAIDRGAPVPPDDERRMAIIRQTGKKISSLPFYDPYGTRDLLNSPDNDTTSGRQEAPESQEDELGAFSALVQRTPELDNFVASAQDPHTELSIVHEAMGEYTALLDADPAKTQKIGLALRKELEDQRAIAKLKNDAAAARSIDMRIALLDAMLKERSGMNRDNLALAA